MEKALNKAIEGGFKTFNYQEDWILKWRMFEIVTLDPLFWQCLGKALEFNGSTYTWQKDGEEKWLTCWHRFIDHIAEGKPVDDFFNELLK